MSFGTDIATVDDFKNFLSTNKPEFVYKLATPVFEPFADQTLPYLSTYDGVTNISNDDALSSTSTNPVQNKVVKAEFDKVTSNLQEQINNSKTKI